MSEDKMTLKQLWSIICGRQTNFRCLNASWTYYPGGDPMGKKQGEGPADKEQEEVSK